MLPEVVVRVATPADAPALLSIYRPYIEHTIITFEEEVPSAIEFGNRISGTLQRYPWLVCTVGGKVAGYAYAARYNERDAYQWSCLASVYLADEARGRGLARPLYEALFDVLRRQGLLTVFALISLPNDSSVRLHERCGFRPFTVFDHIGYKLGAWQKVGWWRLDLNGYPDPPPLPVWFSDLASAAIQPVLSAAAETICLRLAAGQ